MKREKDSSPWETTAALVRRARSGDQTAFAELLNGHRSAITSTLFACGVRQMETAQDLAQDVALRAWNRLPDLKDPRTFTAWVRRIAANAARDHLRRMAVRKEDELDTAIHVEAEDDPHVRAERLAEVRLMLTGRAGCGFVPERPSGPQRAPHKSDTGQSPSPAAQSWASARRQAAGARSARSLPSSSSQTTALGVRRWASAAFRLPIQKAGIEGTDRVSRTRRWVALPRRRPRDPREPTGTRRPGVPGQRQGQIQ